MSEPGLMAQIFGRIAYEFALVQPLLPTYAHLLASALFPIYAGAHASLSRPSSAATPVKKGRKLSLEDDESSDEEEEEEPQRMEGLSPTDALLMPVMAGTTLAGLYFLIKWLQDPALLNKILNWYFAVFGVFSVTRLITDALDIGHSIIFPKRYAFGGKLYHVHGKERRSRPVSAKTKETEVVHSPLPGFMSRIPLSAGLRDMLWSDRAMPGNKWTVRVYLHRMIAARMKIGPHGIVGFIAALCAVAYFNFVGKPWYLTNLMGFGFSYGALQLMSPTTFATGSLILGALFFYDIYFVFFTPMMVTVAKSLDVPIKLVFPRPPAPGADPSLQSLAMLGLGDVVLPGIMIGLALRFDLYLFYFRKQTRAPTSDGVDGAQNTTTTKPKYFSLAGRWSDHFWTHTLTGRPLFSPSLASKAEAPFTFPKTYFNASLIGYILGMLATLGVMQIFGHAQPALLYLVPGVVGSLWLTALVRGEVKEMWAFSEAIDEEEESPKEDKSEGGRTGRSSIFSAESRRRQADKMEKSFARHVKNDEDGRAHDSEDADGMPDGVNGHSGGSNRRPRTTDLVDRKASREVFSFSIEAPWELKKPHSVAKQSHSQQRVTHVEKANSSEVGDENRKPDANWRALERQKTDGEPVGKRLRTR